MECMIGKTYSTNEETEERQRKNSAFEITQLISKNKSSNVNTKNRKSDSTAKSPKTQSFKSPRQNAQNSKKRPGGELNPSEACVSENVVVRSMSMDIYHAADNEAMSELEASTLATVLLEAADALDVLRRTVREDPTSPDDHPPLRIMRRPNASEEKGEKRLLFGEDADFESVVPSVSTRLAKGRCSASVLDLAYDVFRKIAYELEYNGSYNKLRDVVSAIIESKEKEFNVEVNYKIWSDLAEKLRKSQKNFEFEFEIQQKEYMEKIDKLNAEIDSSYCKNNEQLDYISKWEACKLEQQNFHQSLEEKAMMNKIKEVEKSRKAHAKVSKELQAYGISAIKYYENEIATWQDQYNNELEKRQREATELQDKIEETKEFIEKSLQLQAERQVLIDEYNAEQDKIQAEIEYWKDVHASATLIQAIWRGYMVRHELGPYKGYKKKGKKKSKKMKKKKK